VLLLGLLDGARSVLGLLVRAAPRRRS